MPETATTLPRLDSAENIGGSICIWEAGNDDDPPIARMVLDDRDPAQVKARAEDVVRRCNAFDALVTALRDIAQGNVPDEIGESDVDAHLVWSQNIAAAALTLATEGV